MMKLGSSQQRLVTFARFFATYNKRQATLLHSATVFSKIPIRAFGTMPNYKFDDEGYEPNRY